MDLNYINWQEHSSIGIANFSRENHSTDVILSADGQFLSAHKLVLAAASPFFMELFRSNPSNIYYMHGISYDGLCNAIEFIYNGNVELMKVSMEDFVKICRQLKLQGSQSPSASKKSMLLSSRKSNVHQSCRKNCPCICACNKKTKARRRLFFEKAEPMEVT